jgi:carbonic anhydrase
LSRAGTTAGAVAVGTTSTAEAGERERGGLAPHPKTPRQALRALEEGNRRYRRGELTLRDYSPKGVKIASHQKPFAAIITCSDSRFSPPLIFDVQHGNLFVSRVAGNSIDVGMLGSTEYAIAVLGVKLVMVLGHSDCGAVKAAIEVANGKKTYPPDRYGAIGAVIDACVPPIQSIPAGRRSVDRSIRVNAQAQAESLAQRDPIIRPAIDDGKLQVVAAVYDIASGKVSLV